MNSQVDKIMVCPTELNLKFKAMKIMCPKEVVHINGSMQEIGQKNPLKVAKTEAGKLILLDGFKRHLSAAGMNWSEIEIEIIGTTIDMGILKILSDSVDLHLHILEQSKFICYLVEDEKYTVKQISNLLGKSVGWVSNRKNFSTDCPPIISDKIFLGLLPPSSYAMTFRKFIQKLECSNEEISSLAKSVSGKNLSFRQVDELVTAYFTLENGIPEKILEGRITEVLDLIMPSHRTPITKLEAETQQKLEHAILALSSLCSTFSKLKLQTDFTAVFKSIYSSLLASLFSRFEEVNQQIANLPLEKIK